MIKKYITHGDLSHHGIKGQKWGVRRYQNNDGSLTTRGRARYNVNEDGTVRLKKSYRTRKNVVGGIKTVAGLNNIVKGISGIRAAKKVGIKGDDAKKFMTKNVTSMLIGSIVVGSGVKNFVQANRRVTFNSTGMGDSPETFVGKPKTRKQVLQYQQRL